ncbi:MAG: enoyl-CoA hydratase/isomerase family protein [Planctomycetes bacterium]|nr:enoyl-CoA hydratase/isomerase family protein [Planctomycetota bacterium]
MPYENLLVDAREGIGVVTLNRPEARNALDKKTVNELHAALAQLAEDRSVGVVILTGAGDKVFVAGADIKELRTRTKADALARINTGLFAAIDAFEKVTIAAVNGWALGGGFELALACDLRIASPNARFGFPETGLGIIPGAGGTQRLPRLVGLGRAKEIVLLGDTFDAARAEALGIVSRVVSPPDDLLAAARELGRKVLARAPLATRLAKLTLNASARTDLDTGLTIEMLAQAVTFESKDKVEGMTAFIEKRKPAFRGE